LIENNKILTSTDHMHRRAIRCTFFGFWILFAFWGTVDAAEDPMSAAGVLKYSPGITAPGFTIRDMEGRTIQLEDFRGKVVLLNFWTTW
jgi:cytochrome oxidase Cu insertion factor (SCO1/SenC/PrrC family)